MAKVANHRDVRVPPFENRSLESDAAIITSQAAARQLAVRGVRVGGEDAPLQLAGIVESVTTIPTGTPGPQQISLWRVDARLVVELRDPKQQKPLARTVLTDNQAFLPGADVEATEVSRRLAVHHLLERMAANAVDQLRE